MGTCVQGGVRCHPAAVDACGRNVGRLRRAALRRPRARDEAWRRRGRARLGAIRHEADAREGATNAGDAHSSQAAENEVEKERKQLDVPTDNIGREVEATVACRSNVIAEIAKEA